MAMSSNSGSVHDDHRRSSIENYPGDPFTKASDLIEPTVGTVRVSPNFGKKLYTPAVSDSLIPNTDMSFCNLNESYDFYVRYAKESGFGVRKGTEYEVRGVCKIKQYVCSKAGYKQPKPFDSLSDSKAESIEGNKKVKRTRRRASQRTGCKAQMSLRINEKTQKYDVYKFIEEHNHPLVGAADINFLAAYRQLNYSQMQNICSFTQHKIGPARAFSIMRTMYGGFENLGATKEDMKNFKRRLNLFIGEFDADMVVNTLMDKKEFLPDFSFEYTTDEAGQLTALFWADGMMKQTYAYFGDCISFDSTFKSNKYQMVFVPFTGINNHHRNVTFAGALLSKETTESYCWLLTCFKKTFKKPPNVIVTDQDPAMKQAIQIIFPHTRHRFCMWHIMKKVADKVGPVLSSNESFKQRICDIVWTDSITPKTFEMEWIRMIHDFNLVNNDWLSLIFELRFMWIPAYYHNQPMSGLMRTTSRSESENHFFGQVTNAQLTLLEFISHFETAIESQRYIHRKDDHDTRFTNPEFCSNLEMEHEAAELYTRNIFYDVQFEIHDSIHHCISQSTTREEDFCKFFIRDTRVADENYCLEVKLKVGTEIDVSCSCRRFEQYGLLCCHIFYVLRLSDVRHFPRNYAIARWSRNVSYNVVSSKVSSSFARNNDGKPNVEDIVNEIKIASENIVNKLVLDLEQLTLFRDSLNTKLEEVSKLPEVAPSRRTQHLVESFVGVPQPTAPTVRCPSGIRTKGSGKRRRIQSSREIAVGMKTKRKRECNHCKGIGHDISTCKVLKAEIEAKNQAKAKAAAENQTTDGFASAYDEQAAANSFFLSFDATKMLVLEFHSL